MIDVRDTDTGLLSRAEEIALRSASENELLATAAMALLHCRSSDDVYDVIGDFMVRLVPDAIVIVNEALPGLDSFISRKVSGLDGSMLSRAAALIGFEIVGKQSVIPVSLRRQLLNGTLSRIPGGIAELAADEMPRALAEAGAAAFGITGVFTIGIADSERTLGNVHILTRKSRADLPIHTIESFAHHCFSALDGVIRARDLADRSERDGLLVGSMVEGLALHEIILDNNGRAYDYRFLEVNAAFEEMTGLRAEDILGRTALEVLPSVEPFWIDRYARVAMTGVPARFDNYSAALGKHFGVVAYSPRLGQFAALITDMTEQEKAREALLETNARLEQMVHDVAGAMGRIGELRDPYTQGHETRVGGLAKLLAEEMGLSADATAGAEMAALMHDIGKLGVPADILSKPGTLSAAELALMREHPRAGYEILKDIAFPWPVAESVLQHHERMDGSGYPLGLRGDEICPTARILAVADVVEAMANDRPYRRALGIDASVAEIVAHPEKYDHEVSAAFVRLYESGRIVY